MGGLRGHAAKVQLAAIILLISVGCAAAAEGPVTAVQEVLKKQQLLSEEPNGTLDDATRTALRQYQGHRGLPATGEIDTATLEVMERAAEEGANGPDQPNTNVPGVAPATVKKDREFLDQIGVKSVEKGPGAQVTGSSDVSQSPAGSDSSDRESSRKRSQLARHDSLRHHAGQNMVASPNNAAIGENTSVLVANPRGNVATYTRKTTTPSYALTGSEPVGSPQKDNSFFHRLFHHD